MSIKATFHKPHIIGVLRYGQRAMNFYEPGLIGLGLSMIALTVGPTLKTADVLASSAVTVAKIVKAKSAKLKL